MSRGRLQKSCTTKTKGAKVARHGVVMIINARMRNLLRTIVAVAAFALVARSRPATAQAPTARDTAASGKQVAVVIFAEANAKEVRFSKQPQLHVRLSGGLDSVHVLDRRNLPSPVVQGTTYRDVHIAVELFGRVNAECIARTLTQGARDDCASLELRGTSGASSPPPTRSDSTSRSSSTTARPPKT
jgi:hypothetical protein